MKDTSNALSVRHGLLDELVIKESEETLLKHFVKRIPAAVAMFDTELHYIMVSDRWFDETRPKIRDIIGKCHYDVVRDIPEKWKKIHQRCLKGEHIKCDGEVFKRNDGRVEWLRWEVLPWYKDTKVIGGMIMFIEHITERKLAEQKMERIINALNRSNSQLKRFAHMCAHDLSEPLRTISNYIQLTKQQLNDKIDPQVHKYLERVYDSARYMHTLVRDILSYSQLETQNLHLKPTSMEEVFHEIKMALDRTFQEKGVQLHYKDLPTVYADKTLITQVVQNLVSNAIKFNQSTPPKVYVKVKEQKHFWLFSIRDNGIGIEPKDYQKIFLLFGRLHSKYKYNGSGLGLSLCKKIIKDHGGKIWVTSLLQKGSEFSFTLPKEPG
jgi:PAS domain S-box-containing protein